MLIDAMLPVYHAVERHQVEVAAPPGRVWTSIDQVNLVDSRVVRWLFRLRGLPARSVRLTDLERLGFARLAQTPGHEVVYGLIGRFWRPTGQLRATDARHFAAFDEPGYAKAAWSFWVVPADRGGATLLATETRIACTDPASRLAFGCYWAVVGPFSGWTRREMLRLVKARAETE